ncbi:MAG: PAS domain-containing protein [Puia sp.]|nr:PAS domain-containing protein [Puia sp.]
MSSEELGPEKFALHIADHVNAMLAYWDKDLVCRYANRAYSEWFGISSQEMVGKLTLPELLGPELFALNLPYIRKTLNGERQIFERELRTPAGEVKNSLATYYPDLENGNIKGLIVHVAETTLIRNMQETERKLYESRELFERFMEMSPIPAWIRDESGIMQYMNAAYAKAFRLEQQMIGKSLQDIFPARLAEEYLKTTRQVLDTKLPLESTMKFVDERQSVKSYKLIRFPLSYKGRQMIAGWAMDITEQVNAHERVLKLEEEKKWEILRSVIEAQETEKEVISKRIHEHTVQTLSSCKLILDSLTARSADSELLNVTNLNLQTAIEELKYTCDSLIPLTIFDLGLEEAVRDVLRDLRKRHPIRIRICHFDKRAEGIGPSEKLNIFRIISDLLYIIAKYTQASAVEIGLYYHHPVLSLVLEYTGQAVAEFSNIRELQNVKNRIGFYNGLLRFHNAGSARTIEIIINRTKT